jgi:hypothetical protein
LPVAGRATILAALVRLGDGAEAARLNAEGLRARCSHCDYGRRFSPELGGKYFRCPKCRQGVLAVPRASADSQERWRSSEDRWLGTEQAAKDSRAGRGDETPEGIVALARAQKGPARPGGSSRATAKQPAKGPLAETLADPDAAPKKATADTKSEDDRIPIPDEKSETPAAEDASDHRGEVATVRRIIVECGLCGFMVKIPPAFFGKTVHCPECAGDTVFSESALEPVKDELVDRMALDTAERDALFRIDAARAPQRWSTLRSFFVGVALGLVAILGLWGFLRAQQRAKNDALVEAARREGWRWATDERDPLLLHEPWCRELVRIETRVSEEQRAEKKSFLQHDCE